MVHPLAEFSGFLPLLGLPWRSDGYCGCPEAQAAWLRFDCFVWSTFMLAVGCTPLPHPAPRFVTAFFALKCEVCIANVSAVQGRMCSDVQLLMLCILVMQRVPVLVVPVPTPRYFGNGAALSDHAAQCLPL